MTVSLALKDMTVVEKLQVMEAIWDELSRNADDVPSPDWHRELLSEREAAIMRDEVRFEDWATAREKLEQAIK